MFRKSIRKLKRYIIVVVINILIFESLQTYIFNDFEIHFMDVGQGDCTYIKTLYGKNILIDCGNNENYDYGKNVVYKHLIKYGIKQIDYLIISHFDSDHAGGSFYIINNLKVKNIIIPIQYEENDNLNKFLKIANNSNIYIMKAGDNFAIEKDLEIKVLWPCENAIIKENIINNNSLVFKMNFKNISILFTGDIEKSAEEKLVKIYGNDLKSDVLKIAHHGSNTSTIDTFIEKVNPKISLIGVGKNNKYGHPSEEIIERLERNCSIIYRTDKCGEIILNINKKFEFKIRQHAK